MVPVVVDGVVVNGQEVAVVVGVEAVAGVVVYRVVPPVSLLVAVRVNPEVVVVDMRVVNVAVDVDIVEQIGIAHIFAEPADLVRWLPPVRNTVDHERQSKEKSQKRKKTVGPTKSLINITGECGPCPSDNNQRQPEERQGLRVGVEGLTENRARLYEPQLEASCCASA